MIELVLKLQLEGVVPELLAHIRPTTPLRNLKMMKKAIKTIKKTENVDSLRTVHETVSYTHLTLPTKRIV